MNGTVVSCSMLFQTQTHISQGILPLLRNEDVKIAFAKALSLEKKNKSTESNKSKKIADLLDAYSVITSFIQSNNIELVLSLNLLKKEAEKTVFDPPPVKGVTKTANSAILAHKKTFYAGNMLPKRMRFGTYLYYRGIISYYMLKESLAWQKSQRPLMGQIAMQAGFIDPRTFATILFNMKNGQFFGDIAKKKKVISELKIKNIVKIQKKYNSFIGKYFIENHILTQSENDLLHQDMLVHNAKFRFAKSEILFN